MKEAKSPMPGKKGLKRTCGFKQSHPTVPVPDGTQ